MSDFYGFDGRPISDMHEWGEERRRHQRVALYETDAVTISTVFLGLDHQYGDGPPLIFETMIFEAGTLDQECWRYSTVEEARIGHEAAIERWKTVLRYRLADPTLTQP